MKISGMRKPFKIKLHERKRKKAYEWVSFSVIISEHFIFKLFIAKSLCLRVRWIKG